MTQDVSEELTIGIANDLETYTNQTFGLYKSKYMSMSEESALALPITRGEYYKFKNGYECPVFGSDEGFYVKKDSSRLCNEIWLTKAEFEDEYSPIDFTQNNTTEEMKALHEEFRSYSPILAEIVLKAMNLEGVKQPFLKDCKMMLITLCESFDTALNLRD